MQYPIPKGLFDILPQEPQADESWRASSRWQHVESKMRALSFDYNCREIRTPIFERTELFVRGVGEDSDIVSKEMYTFPDKGERSMTLRPEGTAPVIRAFVEKKLYTLAPVHKFFYIGPMFRYERPQAGRYRQFHHFGVEMIGISSPEQDVEMIDMACELYRRLGLSELKVMVNTIGDKESRDAYRLALKEFFRSHLHLLSDDSKTRYEKNVLRILDSKAPEDQEAIAGAPPMQEFLTPSAKAHFETVCKMLSTLGVEWQVNPRLVRGLDYYTHTVFEVSSMHLGAQNALGGGGRYDGLVSAIGGPDLPSLGFAAGIERILLAMDRQGISFPPEPGPLVYLIPLGDEARRQVMLWTSQLRHAGIPSEIDLMGKKIQHSFQMADHLHAGYSLVVGDDELHTGKAMLKNMKTKQAIPVVLADLVSQILHLTKVSQ